MTGKMFTADDVKFTIESIMDPDNGSENAPNYEDVQEINVVDDHTITFKLRCTKRGIFGLYDNGDSAKASLGRRGYAGVRVFPASDWNRTYIS